MDVEGQRNPSALVRGKLAMQVSSAILYGFTAISMNFVNKKALKEFPLSNVLLLNQMCLALVVLPSIKAAGYLTYPAITLKRAVSVLGVTILYVTNVAFSLSSLSSLNIVFYSILKRLTPMMVLIIKVCFCPLQLLFTSFLPAAGGVQRTGQTCQYQRADGV